MIFPILRCDYRVSEDDRDILVSLSCIHFHLGWRCSNVVKAQRQFEVRGGMVDSDAVRIEKAIRKVQESGDESDLIEILLQDALNWPLSDEDDDNIEIDDISYS